MAKHFNKSNSSFSEHFDFRNFDENATVKQEFNEVTKDR